MGALVGLRGWGNKKILHQGTAEDPQRLEVTERMGTSRCLGRIFLGLIRII